MQAHSINPEVTNIFIAQHGYNILVNAKCPLYLTSVFPTDAWHCKQYCKDEQYKHYNF